MDPCTGVKKTVKCIAGSPQRTKMLALKESVHFGWIGNTAPTFDRDLHRCRGGSTKNFRRHRDAGDLCGAWLVLGLALQRYLPRYLERAEWPEPHARWLISGFNSRFERHGAPNDSRTFLGARSHDIRESAEVN